MAKSNVRQDKPLTKPQRELVDKNLGLVAVHIRRNVRNVDSGRSDRQYDDLFQEGCCGLIQAARTYDPDKGIPFAAYALWRIHTAVSGALYESQSAIRTPRRRGRKDADPHRRDEAPKVFALDSDPRDTRHHPYAEGGETLGDRLRSKIEAAVALAARRAGRRRAPRPDRRELMDVLIRERLLVAEPDARTALREIARRTGSSYTRVLQCERRMLQGVRQILSGDLEFRRIVELVRRAPRGADAPVDDDVRGELRRLAAAVLAGRLAACDESFRQKMLWDLLAEDRARLIGVLTAVFDELSDERIEALQVEAAMTP